MGKKLTQAEFIEKAVVAHGVGRYDYSRVVYTGTHKKVEIICPEHGVFYQIAKSHTNGQRCPKCGVKANADARRSTLAGFITRARGVHGDRYDYSKVDYKRSTEAITIICSKHGPFRQRPDCHTNQQQGCPICGAAQAGLSNRLTTNVFIARAREVHGNKYDYSKTEYTTQSEKLTVICPTHGEFLQWPGGHLNGTGCSRCGYEIAASKNTYTTAQFIEQARLAHGDKYDYSQVDYVRNNQEVTILCPTHGLFKQAAVTHMQGRGCYKCGRELVASGHNYTIVEFLTHAREVHGDRYDYSRVTYTKSANKVIIICPEHGEFEQIANSHMQGSGCADCAGIVPITQADFIARARKIHGEKYDYSQVIYTRYEKHVSIICSRHGAFRQRPRQHLKSTGCPKCGRERAQQKQRLHWIEQASGKPCTLYLLRFCADNEEFFKVGITFRSVALRYSGRAGLAGYQYEILAEHKSDAARVWDWEQSILETFKHLRYRPKQHFEGETECFLSCTEILAIFPL